MSKAIMLAVLLAIVWIVNYFIVRIVGLCFGVTVTPLQATGVLVALLWVTVVIGDKK